MIKNTDQQPDEEIHRASSGKVLSIGSFCPHRVGVYYLPGRCMCWSTWKLPKPDATGILWRLSQVHVHAQWLSCVQLFEAPWTVACQTPPPMEFSRQEYWSGLPFPSPGDLPNPGMEMEPRSPALQANSLPAELPGKPMVYFSSLQIWLSIKSTDSKPLSSKFWFNKFAMEPGLFFLKLSCYSCAW